MTTRQAIRLFEQGIAICLHNHRLLFTQLYFGQHRLLWYIIAPRYQRYELCLNLYSLACSCEYDSSMVLQIYVNENSSYTDWQHTDTNSYYSVVYQI